MIKDRIIFVMAIVNLLVLSGCVSVQGELNKPDHVFVESTPTGATVLLNNEVIGITPTNIKLPRTEKSQYLKIIKDGYRPEEIILSAVVQEVDIQKKVILINSTVFFGGVGLLGGLASGVPISGLFGGSIFGLIVGMSQEEKGLSRKYEYLPKNIHMKLFPLLDR